MTNPDAQAFANARPRLKINGEFSSAMEAATLAIDCHQPQSGMAHSEFRFTNWGTVDGGTEPDFILQGIKLGDQIELFFGNSPDSVIFQGEVTAIEERYGEGAPQLILLAEDKLHRLARQRYSRSFENMSLDDVVRQVSSDTGLNCDVSIATFQSTWHQLNESNLAFLMRLAAHHDVNIRLENGMLRAKDEAPDQNPLELNAQNQVDKVRLTVDLNHQVQEVLVKGYNPNSAEAVSGRASSLQPAPSGQSAASALSRQGWQEQVVAPHPFARSQAEADALAKKRYRNRAKRFVYGELVCRGQPSLNVSREIKLSGVSSRFAGLYKIVDCNHRFDQSNGYQTRLKLQKPDWKP